MADPGYLGLGADPVLPGVVWIGHLPEARLHDWMRRALCLFHPQTSAGEGFGRVVAEANALGTPVLLHRDFAANAELAGNAGQLVDGYSAGEIAARLDDWRRHPPKVAADPRHRLSAVAAAWRCLLLDMEAPRRAPAPSMPGGPAA